VPIVQPRGELTGLLAADFPKTRLSDMALDEAIRSRVDRVLLEQRQREKILAHGLRPLRKLLLVGPPGTGKTMTASALAGELAVPLFTTQLDGLITKYLGETAAKLRMIFEAIRQTRAVYLFDEFDALGGERAAKNEVGEIRRVLNSFLQFLEQDESDSIIVAATNHPQILDKALFRRFDSVIEYKLPSENIIEEVMRARLSLLDTSRVNWPEVVEAAKGLSHSDLTRACEHAAKNAILEHHTRIDMPELIKALSERRSIHC
jgi:SpoVK/Ycf46/Vps4 family AAA+-type ATPase